MSQTDVQVRGQLDATATSGSPEPKPRPAPRLYALDALRVVAALAVMIFHYTGIDAATKANWGVHPRELFPELFPFTVYGNYGVQLFFIISGFVICLSAWGRTPGAFVKARFLRLFPAYWFSVVVALLIWRGVPDGQRQVPTISDSLTNFTMFQVPLSARHLVGAYWTLWVELTFYMIFLVVVWKGLDYMRVTVFCWIWLIAGVLMQQTGQAVPLLSVFTQPLNTALFVAGIAMYLMYRFGPDLKLWGLLGASWLVMQSDLFESVMNGREKGYNRSFYVALGIVTACYLLVLAVALRKLDWVNWKWLATAGALVYPLYLLHEELGWAVIRQLYGRGLGPWPTLAITTAAMLLLAWLTHVLVEKPSVRWLKTRLARESGTPKELSR